MLKAFFGKMNVNRFVMTTFAVFVYIFASDFLIHGVILQGTYKETASLWRPESEMHSYMVWMLMGQFMIAKGLSFVFAKGYEGKGVMEGVRFGLVMSPLILASTLIQYAVTPLPMSLFLAWLGFGFVQVILGGVVASLVYRK